MKKKYYLLSIVFSFLTIPFVFSQNINQEYIFTENSFININSILNVGDKTYLGGSIGSCRIGAAGIINHQNEYEFFSGVENGYWDVDELELRAVDNMIIGSGNWFAGDDFPDPNDGPYVFGMNLDGELLFEKHLNELGSDSLGIVNDFGVYLTHTDDGEIKIAFRNYIAELDSFGELVNLINYGFNNDFLNINRINSNTFFTYTKRELLLINDAGVQLDLVNSSTDILDVYSDSENIYCLRTNDIMIYNVILEEVTFSINHLSSIENAKGITGNSNSLFLYQKNLEEETDEIIQLNKSNLSVINGTDFLFDKEETKILNVLATENDLQIIGKESNFQPFIKSKPILADLVFDDMEIEVVSITPLGEITIVDSIVAGPDVYYEMEGNVPYEFVIQNNSEETLHSFSMTGNHLGGVNCSVWLHFNHYDSLSIPSGGSMTFTKSISFTGHYLTPPSYNLPEIYVDIFGPNHRFDEDLSNNSSSVPVVLTATKELYFLTTEWEVYPNPVKDNIHFNASLKEKSDDVKITIYNSIGEEVKQIIPNINHLEIQELISVNDLPNGLYFLNLSTAKGNETRSILINK